MFTRKRFVYSQQELSEHIGQIGALVSKREKTLQLATVTRSDPKADKYLREVDRYDDMIATAQESLKYMLLKNSKRAGQ